MNLSNASRFSKKRNVIIGRVFSKFYEKKKKNLPEIFVEKSLLPFQSYQLFLTPPPRTVSLAAPAVYTVPTDVIPSRGFKLKCLCHLPWVCCYK